MGFFQKDLAKLNNPKMLKTGAAIASILLAGVNLLVASNDQKASEERVVEKVYEKMTKNNS